MKAISALSRPPQQRSCPSRSLISTTVWPESITEDQWSTFVEVFDLLKAHHQPFIVGGAIALASYTKRWRNTKDLDLYIFPEQQHEIASLLEQIGFRDLFEEKPYDRRWIYRATRQGMIIDLIWRFANLHAELDETWFNNACPVLIREESVNILGPEELIWSKLFIIQRERCDWPDVLNLFQATHTKMDWNHLVHRLHGDLPLLDAAISVYEWMWPGEPLAIPPGLRRHIKRKALRKVSSPRVHLLDTRDWFGIPQGATI